MTNVGRPVIREQLEAYRFFTHPPQFLDKRSLRGNPEALREVVGQYAQRLEEVARRHPFQWHNIYPYWDETAGPR